jgi:hypothetical protein
MRSWEDLEARGFQVLRLGAGLARSLERISRLDEASRS